LSNAAEYPKTLIHPGYAPAKISESRIPGVPARFPPVIVYDSDQEEECCAKGYLPSQLVSAPDHLPGEAERVTFADPDLAAKYDAQVVRSIIPEAVAAPPPVRQQIFNQGRYRALIDEQIDAERRALLEGRKAASARDAQHGWLPLSRVLEKISWPELIIDLRRGTKKATCHVEWADGVREHRDFDPAWLECLPEARESPGFDRPDADVLWFDQAIARRNRMKVPVRVSDIAVEIVGIEEMRPEAMQIPHSDASTAAAPDDTAGSTVELGAPNIGAEQCSGVPVPAGGDASKPKKRGGGRNPGDGAKNDEAELGSMLRLVAENKVTSSNAAALKIIEESRARGEKLAQNAHRRLSKKFLNKYRSQRRDGETWGDCCRRIADELQPK
jgi:hypothetical protein